MFFSGLNIETIRANRRHSISDMFVIVEHIKNVNNPATALTSPTFDMETLTSIVDDLRTVRDMSLRVVDFLGQIPGDQYGGTVELYRELSRIPLKMDKMYEKINQQVNNTSQP